MSGASGNGTRERFQKDPWFSGLPEALQTALLVHAVWQKVEPHQAQTHGGGTSGGIVGLAEGNAIIVPAVGPPDAGPIHLFRAPLWFGLMPLSGKTDRVPCRPLPNRHAGWPAFRKRTCCNCLARNPAGGSTCTIWH